MLFMCERDRMARLQFRGRLLRTGCQRRVESIADFPEGIDVIGILDANGKRRLET